MEDNLLKSLQTIAIGQSNGIVSTDILIKACNRYKIKTNFDDGYRYQLILSKTLNDQLNGLEQDIELCKAILPGETKVIDGVLYQWSATKVGSKTQYAWHVVNKGGVTGSNIGKGSTLTSKKIQELEKEVNEMFPTDLNSLKEIKAAGGSTGAKIVEDVNGNRYILKRGDNTNTNDAHVINEYLANQLYDIAGVKVPNYQLYDDNGTAVLLSRFIYNARTIQPKDYPELAKSFIIDTLFSNWDAYQNNDNCLVDSKGNIIHVDNGGTLAFRAHGKAKKFDDDILDTYQAMVSYNQNISKLLTDDDVLKQIDEVKKKKDDLVNYLKEVGEDELAKTIGNRIDNLDKIVNEIEKRNNIGKRKVLPRKLKSDKEMYRTFTKQELDELWDEIKKENPSDPPAAGLLKTKVNPGNGWSVLSKICKMRGFDARGRVVEDDEYWKKIDDDIKKGKFNQLFRGLAPNKGNFGGKGKVTVDEMIDSLLYQDECFYGTQGVYGAGIYSHLNDNGASADIQSKGNYNAKTNYGYKNGAYNHAVQYAQDGGIGKGIIVKMALEDDAFVAEYDDIWEEIKNLAPGVDKVKISKCEAELDKIDDKINKINEDINNFTKKITEDVYEKTHYDEEAWKDYSLTESTVNWGAKNPLGDRDIPKFNDFVTSEMKKLVESNGGVMETFNGGVKFKLPNSDEVITISEYQYDGPHSIKQKRTGIYYNHAVERFGNWFERNQVKIVEQEKEKAISSSSSGKQKLMNEKQKLTSERVKKADELDALRQPGKNVNPDDGIYEAIYHLCVNKHLTEPLGVYAALKGYDAIRVKNGNGRGNSFHIILNRSKVIINKKIDMNI